MMTAIIVDIVLVAILLFFLWRGKEKGLILSLCGLLAVLVAVVGADLISDALAPRVAQAMEPRFAAAIEETLGQELEDRLAQSDAQVDGVLGDILSAIQGTSLYQSISDAVHQAVEQGIDEVGETLGAVIAQAIALSVARMLLFFVSFVLLLAVWFLLSHALDLAFRLPVLSTLNGLGGAALGLLKGMVLLFVAGWLLNYFGGIVPPELVEQTRVLKFFMTTNPVTLILGLV